MSIREETEGDINYWDDISGKCLLEEQVTQARQQELDEHDKHEVYKKVDTEECYNNT